MRIDGRETTQLRDIRFDTGFIKHHPGSVLVSFGDTRVLVTATSNEDRVPPFRMNSGGGWLTAEYAMLPASTHTRRGREKTKPDGRSVEIQRLIGRALRNVVDIDKIGKRTIQVDCDVLQADGGTRTASITGAWVALHLCLRDLIDRGAQITKKLDKMLTGQVAAVSLGILGDAILTDLNYAEDSKADTDLNLVGRSDGTLIEVQGTAEGAPMSRAQLGALVDQGMAAIDELCALQRKAVGL